MRTVIAIATLIALTAPASALCVVAPDDGEGYPPGQQALLLCQQAELNDTVEDRAVAEQFRAMRAQLQALQFQQQRLQVRPLSPFDQLRF
jgi:hypothetical protein